jgi:predicted small integral membrane protein
MREAGPRKAIVPDGLGSLAALRLAKAALVAAVAFNFTLVVVGNVSDYGANFAFVEHVLRMDTVFPGSALVWRALASPLAHHAFYALIIAWEALAAAFLWMGVLRLSRGARGGGAYLAARRFAAVALVSGLLLWLVAFVTVGGEWFLMWQSKTWNGLDAAGRNFTIQALVLLVLLSPEPAE